MKFAEQQYVSELKRRIKELESQVETDPLTGLLNRRGLERRLEDAAAYAARANTQLAVAVLDVDHFKQVNDTHGHDAGDDALRRLGALIRRVVRRYDACGRWGGEEFVLVLTGMNRTRALAITERLRRYAEAQLVTTVSIGVTMVEGGDWRNAMVSADRALYAAKHAGRNCVSHG